MKPSLYVVTLLSVALLVTSLLSPRLPADEVTPTAVPPFTHQSENDWLGSPPLDWAGLRGQVVLLDIWTFGCWNCYRSFPWLTGLEKRFAGRPFRVIGIHTPEFEHEKAHRRIAEKMVEFGLHHPVMVDNDSSYWRALGNRYWPTFYLVDGEGRIRYRFIGETHADTRQAHKIEAAITKLLAELAQ